MIDAAMIKSYEVLYVLLEAGADIMAKDNNGFPASFEIIAYGDTSNPKLKIWREKCMEFMEKKGIDFEKEKIQYEEIFGQKQMKHEND